MSEWGQFDSVKIFICAMTRFKRKLDKITLIVHILKSAPHHA
jgi:hypothetical protein